MNLKRKLWILSGDDFNIICQCDRQLQNRFAAIGLFVLAIFILCFISSYFTFTKLLQNFFIGIPIGLFFAWMVTNIYLFLLYTLSKNVLPHRRRRFLRFLSIILRIFFICFIATIVSKPLEALLFSIPLNSEITTFKQEQLTTFKTITTEYFDTEINGLKQLNEEQKRLNGSLKNEIIEKNQLLITKKESEKRELISKMENLVGRSNYYIQSIVILNTKYWFCWAFTILTILVFLAPAYLKNFLDEHNNFYNCKKEIETKLILKEYSLLEQKYNLLLQENFQTDKSFCEIYADAPFDTILKKDERKFLPENDLIAELYNA
jgi:hypothetical protein